MPKQKDIGLIFDVTLENSNEECNELLTFRIGASGYCCVNLTPAVVMEKMGHIVGGNFGFIEPGAIEKVSLIWPTVSLYNRVGLCPIAITSRNINNEERTIKQMIKFDTTFQALDPDNRTLRQNKEFMDCHNWDKDYLKNCSPVDCEERYFGLRNFYNTTSERCEVVPRCSEKYQLYNVFTNECIDTRVILSDEDLKRFKEGAYENNVWEIKTKCNQVEKPNNVMRSDFMKHSSLFPVEQVSEESLLEWKIRSERSAWLFGLGKALLIVFATIVIYLLICFSIFLFVSWLSRRSSQSRDASGRPIIVTPRHWGLSEENIPLYTTTSSISHR